MKNFNKKIVVAVMLLLVLFANNSFADNENRITFTVEKGESQYSYYNLYLMKENSKYEVTSVKYIDKYNRVQTVNSSYIHGASSPKVFNLSPGTEYFIDVSNENVELLVDPFDASLTEKVYNVSGGEHTYVPKQEPNLFEEVFAFFVRLIGEIINKLIGLLAGEPLSVDKLVFDDYSRAQLTFFEKDLRFYNNGYNPLIKGSIKPLNRIFSLFRNLALVAYMAILVYLGIRVLLFSTGDRQAKYKQVLVDWVKGIAIIFLFPYVIRYAINLNHALVSYLQTSSQNFLANDNVATISVQGGTIADSNNNTEISSEKSGYMYEMYQQAKEGWLAPAICWFIMLIQIVQFLIVYYKRLITVMFLIAIFPLVSISYALDKIADGKSQAFNNWCKEFFLQVFIQSFHAINYVLVMSIICNLQPENWLLKIIGITYVSKGADVIKNMFAQIRGTKGGGPLELAKSMIKTKVAIDSVKSLKNFASSTFGANSRLGKGLQRIDLARSEAAQGKLAASVSNRNEALRASGNMFNPNGSASRPLTDNEAKQYMRDVLDENKRKTDKNHKEKVDALARMDSSEIERLANEEGYTDHKKRNLEYLLNVAAANGIVHGAKNGRPDVNVTSAVNILIKEKGKNSIASRYMAESNIPSENALRGMAAANSIVVDEDSAIAHRQARASEPADLDAKDRTRNAMLRLKDAHNGCGLMELHEDIEIVNEARASGDAELNAIIDAEEKDMDFTLEDLELNLYAQVVNHSNDPEFYNNPEGRKLTDKSIAKLKEAQGNLKTETDVAKRTVQRRILAGVNAKIEDLNEGETPVLIDREIQRNSALQKELDTRLDELRNNVKNITGVDLDANEFLDKGPEHDAYLANKAQEYQRMATHDWIAGGLETVAGVAISGKMLAHGTALSGVMVGASTEGKNDVFSDVIKNAPAGYSIVSSVTKEAEDVASVPFSAVDSAIDRRLVGDRVSLKNNRKSVEINEKYYTDQARSNAVNSEISQAETTRRALLKRLNDMNNTKN